jgi:hypothetical protein
MRADVLVVGELNGEDSVRADGALLRGCGAGFEIGGVNLIGFDIWIGGGRDGEGPPGFVGFGADAQQSGLGGVAPFGKI